LFCYCESSIIFSLLFKLTVKVQRVNSTARLTMLHCRSFMIMAFIHWLTLLALATPLTHPSLSTRRSATLYPRHHRRSTECYFHLHRIRRALCLEAPDVTFRSPLRRDVYNREWKTRRALTKLKSVHRLSLPTVRRRSVYVFFAHVVT